MSGRPNGDQRARASAQACAVEVITSPAAFAAVRQEWNDLVARVDDQFLYRHEFIATWLEHFGENCGQTVLVRDQAGQLIGILPLASRPVSIGGIRLTALHSACNEHSGRFDLIATRPEAVSQAIVAHLCQRRDWRVLVLAEMPASSAGTALVDAAAAAGLATGCWVPPASPVLMLPAQWSQLAAHLSSSFLANLRRRRKKLQGAGSVSIRRSGNDLALLEEGMQLEAAGWKGRAGTAMIQHPATSGFYRELAAQAVGLGALALWELRFNGRLIAFQYGLEYCRRYCLLKLAHDEEFAGFGPGQLLTESVIRDAIERGLEEYDFLGDEADWKLSWQPQLRARRWFYVFADAGLPRLAHRMKFILAPALRTLMARR